MRDCANCIRSKGATQWDNGCTSWDCDFIDRKEAIAAYERDVWFPLNIAMPKPHDNVLITDGDGYIRHCYLDELGTFRTCEEGMSVGRVKAWRPLPEPYKEGE